MADLNRRAQGIAMLELARAALEAAAKLDVYVPSRKDVVQELERQRTYLDDEVRRLAMTSLAVITSPDPTESPA